MSKYSNIDFTSGKATYLAIERIVTKTFQIDSLDITPKLQKLLSSFQSNLFFLSEYPYNDSVYRDSYYHYFAGKFAEYSRHCLRLSFYSEDIDPADFESEDGHLKLQRTFMGYVVLRPISQAQIGRSLIAPEAFNSTVPPICRCKDEISVRGAKLIVSGFPHASQDGEMGRCAETAVWCIMRYFSLKYAEYAPALPSRIFRTLEKAMPERQVPSVGLSDKEICTALKAFGLPTYQYSWMSGDRDKAEFFEVAKSYAKSGIPTVLICQAGIELHAMLVIGFDEVQNGFVVQDDNEPPYRTIDIHKPVAGYTPKPHPLDPVTLIVPLYKRLHLEAQRAIAYMGALPGYLFDLSPGFEMPCNKINAFIASSRSLKFFISRQIGLNPIAKAIILDMSLPKFVWVGEFYGQEVHQVSAWSLLDATETRHPANQGGLLIAINDGGLYLTSDKKFVTLHSGLGVLEPYNLNLS